MQITPPPDEAIYRKYVVAVPVDEYPRDETSSDQTYQMPWPPPKADFLEAYPDFMALLPDLGSISAGDVLVANGFNSNYSNAVEFIAKDIEHYLLAVVEVAQAMACVSVEVSWAQKDKAESELKVNGKAGTLLTKAEIDFRNKLSEVSNLNFGLSYKGSPNGKSEVERAHEILLSRRLQGDNFLEALISIGSSPNTPAEFTKSLHIVQESFRTYVSAINAKAKILSGKIEIDVDKVNLTSLEFKVTCKFGSI